MVQGGITNAEHSIGINIQRDITYSHITYYVVRVDQAIYTEIRSKTEEKTLEPFQQKVSEIPSAF